MGSRTVLYSVAGVVALGLLAASALKSRQPAQDSVAVAAPVSNPVRSAVAKRNTAKPVLSAAKPAAPESQFLGGLPRAYRVLLAHSVFCSQPTMTGGGAKGNGEPQFTLRGVMQRGKGFIACVEDASSRQAVEVKVGDAVGSGRLIAIDLEGVRYSAQGRDIRVEVGQTFSGARRVATAQTSDMTTLHQITE